MRRVDDDQRDARGSRRVEDVESGCCRQPRLRLKRLKQIALDKAVDQAVNRIEFGLNGDGLGGSRIGSRRILEEIDSELHDRLFRTGIERQRICRRDDRRRVEVASSKKSLLGRFGKPFGIREELLPQERRRLLFDLNGERDVLRRRRGPG